MLRDMSIDRAERGILLERQFKKAEKAIKQLRKGGRQMSDEKAKEKAKKQIPLRVSASLYTEIAQWAEDDFRSINGQIEFLLTECVKYRKKKYKE